MYEQKALSLKDGIRLSGPSAFMTMLKPAGSTCNLDCSYCYYLDKAAQYGGRQAVMSEQLLEEYVRQYIEANDVDTVTFCWHGGEPTLLGIPYYRKALEFQNKYAANKKIVNTLQTNGTLIDEDWCRFFAENGFLVGVSIDGPKHIHDAFRRTRGGAPTFDKVMSAIRLMRRSGVEYNTLSVVNRLSEKHGREIYRFFRDTVRTHYMQFLPAVEHVISKDGFHRPFIVSPQTPGAVPASWSVSAEGYGRFLCDVFDQWVTRDVGEYYVQIFDSTLAQWCGQMPGVCSLAETCGDSLVVEHNGDVYSCDHFVYPEYLLGNIRNATLREIYALPERFRFGLAKRDALPIACRECRYFFACHGECPKHRFEETPDGRANSLCSGLKMFFSHVEPYMDYMKERLEQGQAPSWVMQFARKRGLRG